VVLDAPGAPAVEPVEPAEPETASRPSVATLTDEYVMAQEIAWAKGQQLSLGGPLALMISGYGVFIVGAAIDLVFGMVDLSVAGISSAFNHSSIAPDPTPYVVGTIIAGVGLLVGLAGIPWLVAVVKQRGPYARRINAIEELRDSRRALQPPAMPPLSFAF